MPEMDIASILLPNDDPAVIQMLAKMEDHKIKADERNGSRVQWKTDHSNIREVMKSMHGIHIPSLAMLSSSDLATGASKYLLDREQDVFLIHKFVSQDFLKRDVEDFHFMWEMQLSAKWAKFSKEPSCSGLLSCVTTGSKPYCTHRDVNP